MSHINRMKSDKPIRNCSILYNRVNRHMHLIHNTVNQDLAVIRSRERKMNLYKLHVLQDMRRHKTNGTQRLLLLRSMCNCFRVCRQGSIYNMGATLFHGGRLSTWWRWGDFCDTMKSAGQRVTSAGGATFVGGRLYCIRHRETRAA